MYDEAWWHRRGRGVKTALTFAERVIESDPARAINVAEATFALMEEHGYPDWWSRVERLRHDALEAELRRGVVSY